MCDCYKDLEVINIEMIGGHNIRIKNHEEGIETLKQINAIIQRASRLRGKHIFNIARHEEQRQYSRVTLLIIFVSQLVNSTL